MGTWAIPLPDSTEPHITQSVSMDGRTYVMEINWNSRTDRWTMSLSTEAGDAIINGALLAVGLDILRTIPWTLDYVPPGVLMLGGPDDPTLETVPATVLFYVSEDL